MLAGGKRLPVASCIHAAVAATLLGCAVPGWAIDGRADTVQGGEPQAAQQDAITYKFTPTYYHTTAGLRSESARQPRRAYGVDRLLPAHE